MWRPSRSRSVRAGQSHKILSAGPLTRIEITNDLNCAVDHTGDTDPEFFGDTACGSLVAVGGTLYGPAAIPAGGSASPRTPYSPVSQTDVLGSGTIGDPYRIVTVVALGTTGLQLTETDSYVVGQETYRTDVQIASSAGTSVDAILYRAGDCFLQNSDFGFGAADAATGAVSCVAGVDNGTRHHRARHPDRAVVPALGRKLLLRVGLLLPCGRRSARRRRSRTAVDNATATSTTVPGSAGT